MHAADAQLQPKSALASLPEAAEGWTAPGLAIAETRGTSLAFVLARAEHIAQLRAAVVDEFGITLPDDGQLAVGERMTLVSCAPGAYLALTTSGTDRTSVFANIRQRLGGLAEVVDCSDNFTLLSVGGSRIQKLLAKVCAIDLDAPGVPAQLALITLIFQIRTYLWRQTPAGPYTMMIPRSLAVCFWDALVGMAQSQDEPAHYHQRL
jgi:heterotetrameric sarcosine oxidase gamma subunit